MNSVIDVECHRSSCSHNEDGICKGDPEEISCDKNLFRCKRCGHELMKKNPLSTSRCPNCRTTNWDIEEYECYECGHRWNSRMNSPNRCPECRMELEHV